MIVGEVQQAKIASVQDNTIFFIDKTATDVLFSPFYKCVINQLVSIDKPY